MEDLLILDLSQRCIEAAARREHRRLCEMILTIPHPEPEVKEKLAVLQEFLEHTDFSRLRAERPELGGGSAVLVAISRSGCGAFQIRKRLRSS